MRRRHQRPADQPVERPRLDESRELLEQIYAAVGDMDLWNDMVSRFTGRLTPELKIHLEMARQMHERQTTLSQQIHVLSAAHAQLAVGTLVVDDRRAVLFANVVADRLLMDDGSGLTRIDNHLHATDPDHDAALAAAVAAASSGKRNAPFVLIPRPNRCPVTVMVLPQPPARGAFSNDIRRGLLLVFDPDAVRLPSTDVLRTLFGFTVREAECAAHLMRGRTLIETARLMGIGRNTVRTFLARMTAKTDSHGQAEFVARLLAIPTVSELSAEELSRK